MSASQSFAPGNGVVVKGEICSGEPLIIEG